MEKKKRLAGKRVYIDHLTEERRIQRELRERARREKQKLGTAKYI